MRQKATRPVTALADVRAAIDELDDIAGRLVRSATAHGASWDDIGSSLRMTANQARLAYGAEGSRSLRG